MPEQKRLCLHVSLREYTRFKEIAGRRFEWQPGYTNMALRECLHTWFVFVTMPPYIREPILKRAKEKYPHCNDVEALQNMIMEILYQEIKKTEKQD